MTSRTYLTVFLFLVLACASGMPADETQNAHSPEITAALTRAGDNADQLTEALQQVPDSMREGMEFLVANMSDRDLTQLSSDFLLENVRFAYQAWHDAPWCDQIPKEIFLNNVLPYASVDERRDNWRKDFFKRFGPLAKEAKSPGEAATILNRKIFGLLDVRYSTKRPKANQSPYESTDAKMASCTGLSLLLIDACRAVGVPARFVGTPLWSDRSGNHSWVEVWDDGWHFTGAAEPAGDELDRAWFAGRASKSQRDDPRHAIFAVSFKRTPLNFPMVWSRRDRSVYAVNVTDRYTRKKETLPDGSVEVMVRVLDKSGGERRAAQIKVAQAGKSLFEGKTKDERFDANDHVTIILPKDASFDVDIRFEGMSRTANISPTKNGQLFTFFLNGD